jgi:hypothetical protein
MIQNKRLHLPEEWSHGILHPELVVGLVFKTLKLLSKSLDVGGKSTHSP